MIGAEVPVRIAEKDDSRARAEGAAGQAALCIPVPFSHSAPMGDPDNPDPVFASNYGIFRGNPVVDRDNDFQRVYVELYEH